MIAMKYMTESPSERLKKAREQYTGRENLDNPYSNTVIREESIDYEAWTKFISYYRYYIDEFHLLLKDEQTAAYCVEIWKRFRKWGGIPTGELVCYLLVA